MKPQWARAIIFLISILSIGAIFVLPRLEFDYEFENFFPKGDPDLQKYLEFREKFTTDNDFILFAIENEGGIFQEDFLKKVQRFADTLISVPFITEVVSPMSVKSFVMGPFGPIEVPYLHVDDPKRYASDSSRIYQSENLVGSLFSKDGRSLSIVAMNTPYLSKAKSDTLAVGIEKLMASFDFENVRMSGRAIGQRYYINTMKSEMAFFILLGIVILIVVLTLSFRTFYGVWVPLLVIMLTAIWLLALMYLTGKSIDIMATLLPTILFVVGISDIVHIYSRYLEELRKGNAKYDSLRITIKEIGMATFLTSLTTAIGFFTLITATVAPVQEFGIYTGIGVFIAFILSFTLFPSLLQLFPIPKSAKKPQHTLVWHRWMVMLFSWVVRCRVKIIWGSFFFICLTLVGVSQLKIDNYLLEDLSRDDPHRQNFIFFEEHFSGVRPFEMALEVKDTNLNLLDYEVLVELDKVETYLKEVYGVGSIVSPLTLVKTANQTMEGGHPKEFKLPADETAYKRVKKLIRHFQKRPEFKYVATDDLLLGRLSGKIVDLGARAIERKNLTLEKTLRPTINNKILEYNQTGMALMLDKSNSTLASNMMFGLLIAFGVIALIMGLLFRSLKIVVISLLPNILPLLVIGAVMGFLGIFLNVATSIVFTIAFGIAVDDTIHYMTKFKLELQKGKRPLYALKRTSISTGKAITVTSIILCSGFVTLITSTFTSTYYIGLLVSITLGVAVISDLVLLPALLIIFYGKGK